MREFHEAVSALLDAFSRGISIIKTQKSRRGKERRYLDSSHKAAESELRKSLKKSKTDIETIYGRDVARFGPGFAVGDAEAHSSLSSILFRINAGFISVIERFMRGCSSPTDYQALVNLSNSSRLEAIHTFEQLSQRLSRSSLVLSPSRKTSDEDSRKSQRGKVAVQSGTTKHQRHVRAKSAPELSPTPLGPATTAGWIRPKPGRRTSSDSKASNTSTPTITSKRPSNNPRPPAPRSGHSPSPKPNPSKPTSTAITTTQRRPSPQSQPPSPSPSPQPSANPPRRTHLRHSIISFASDSTKLGEIPEHKWTRPMMFEGADAEFPMKAYYPLEQYRPPEKQKGRFMRLFRRG